MDPFRVAKLGRARLAVARKIPYEIPREPGTATRDKKCRRESGRDPALRSVVHRESPFPSRCRSNSAIDFIARSARARSNERKGENSRSLSAASPEYKNRDGLPLFRGVVPHLPPAVSSSVPLFQNAEDKLSA